MDRLGEVAEEASLSTSSFGGVSWGLSHNPIYPGTVLTLNELKFSGPGIT